MTVTIEPLIKCSCGVQLRFAFEDVIQKAFMRFEVPCPACGFTVRLKRKYFSTLFSKEIEREMKEREERGHLTDKAYQRQKSLEQKALEVYAAYEKNDGDLKATATALKMTQKAVREILDHLPQMQAS